MAQLQFLTGLRKTVVFYARFTPSFSRIGYVARGLPLRAIRGNYRGQNWLVSGATGGLGRAIALRAARNGARVFALGRNEAALKDLAESVQGLAGSIAPVTIDVSSIRALATLAKDWPKDAPLDVLVNNVGVLNREYERTAEGFEASYAINLLGHFALTEGLMAANALKPNAAVINVVSGGLYNAPLNVDGLNIDQKKFNGFLAYASHKRAQLALADHWREKWGARGMAFYAVHPGWADTPGVRRSLPTFRKVLQSVLRNAYQGTDTIEWLAAKRPAETPDKVWFDRKPRTAHVYAHTVKPQTTVEAVVAHLRQDLARLGRQPAAA